MSQRADLLYNHRQYNTPSGQDDHLNKRIADGMSRFWIERDARIQRHQAAYTKTVYGTGRIEPLRGTKRPIVVFTMGDVSGGRFALFSSVTKAAIAIGIMNCTLCEAIRKQRLAGGHVVRYLDQVDKVGRVVGSRFVVQDRHELTFSTRELVRIENADADAPATVMSN